MTFYQWKLLYHWGNSWNLAGRSDGKVHKGLLSSFIIVFLFLIIPGLLKFYDDLDTLKLVFLSYEKVVEFLIVDKI